MECLIHSPAFNNVKMAWVAGVGHALRRDLPGVLGLLHRRRRGLHRRSELRGTLPSPVTRFFEGGRVSQTLDGVSKTLFDST